ncbi:laminin subunit gamma-1 isoform X2 [Neocloeon triangulifer]|uniref:laminin subunit gamma-1 isoform X2 n=1 Tax=Neocloeon triangulifer TaxID=2078957 RepID=UPI00286F3441|nr:laminin subunit gamma-1 isoform X2 [Neocloeon triangulifer]
MMGPSLCLLLALARLATLAAATKWDGITPWFSGSSCNCNGFSNRCFFDQELYARTGHGGHCLDCTGNRDGPNCERCKENFFQREDGYCIPCNCNEVGSRSLQCNSEGKCQCKAGVTGDKCDRCDANFFDFGPLGCKPCGCSEAGSFRNKPRCDPNSGVCHCKLHVEGNRCDRCKPSFFNLDLENDFGCTPCFCYGHSSVCQSAPGYSQVNLESMFVRGQDRWTAQEASGQSTSLQYNALTQSIALSAVGNAPVYFIAPDRFLGDMRASYNRDLSFKLRIGSEGPSSSVEDIILEGDGEKVVQTIFGQGNDLPKTSIREYTFRLHEDSEYGWQPRLSAREYMRILSNLTAIKIRGTYTYDGVGYLKDFKLQTARRDTGGKPANWIEMCTCPEGYVGQFCESCAPGYRHEPNYGGRFARCVPCNCNGHADICDADTGRCICQHNTAGENCELCARGFYGNALAGTDSDCQPCPCPNQSACVQLLDETVVCLECPKGYGGPRCDICSDGYFGDPEGRFGSFRSKCEPCDCNSNVDPNGIGNCNRTTGECLKCIYNTGGSHCEVCLPGFFGDALSLPKGDCKTCQCNGLGTERTKEGPFACDQISGQCRCKPYVTGKNCDVCEDGFYNINSGEGCQACNCDPIGSLDGTCDMTTGQCKCRPGVTGLRCDVCETFHFGFSTTGCKHCNCDEVGSRNLQCDEYGQCPCNENVEGLTCNQCKENTHDKQRGCVDCDDCYNLVQDAVNDHRSKLDKLLELLANITDTPTVIDDVDFERKLTEVQKSVDQLWNDAKKGAGSGDKSLLEKLKDLKNRLQSIGEIHKNITMFTETARVFTTQGEANATQVEDTIERARESLKNAVDYLQTEGAEALKEAVQRSEQFGQQSEKMSDIARQARQLAQEQEKEAEEIKKIAEEAVKTSSDAFDVAKNAINEQKTTKDELGRLRHELEAVADRLDKTKILAQTAKDKASQMLNESLAIYAVVYGLKLPEPDVPKLKSDAEVAAEEARKLKSEADKVLADHGDLLGDLAEQSANLKELLRLAQEQQQTVDELLADVDNADSEAQEAVKLGDKTLAEAQETLKTLQEFDKDVQKSKDKAQEALDKIDEIEEMIQKARVTTEQAAVALTDAEDHAKAAKDAAFEAQNDYAAKASDEADEIRNSADATRKKAEGLRDAADKLSSQVATTGGKVQQLELQANTDETLTNEAKEKVGQAKSNSAEASKRVEKALQEVEDIMKELQDVTDIDEDQLNILEKKLAAAEKEFQDANLDQRMEELKMLKNQQTQWIKDYSEEVARLRIEVDNIDEIRKSLPDGCWKRVKLEP